MGEVTGYTAERMKRIEDTTIVGGSVHVDGHLWLNPRVGVALDAGNVTGPRGLTGPTSIYICDRASRPIGAALFEGLYIYERDTDQTFVYDGATWVYKGGIIFCTSGTRPLGIARFVGLKIYETDTFKEFVWNGFRWDPPWNTQWGVMPTPTFLSNLEHSMTGTSPVTIPELFTNFTAISNRLYRATVMVPIIYLQYPDDGASIVKGYICDSANDIRGSFCDIRLDPAGTPRVTATGSCFMTFPTGATTVKARVSSSLSSIIAASDATSQAYIVVEDVGSNGAPAA